jgi:tetratricopeptide (TPR) repeat protein
MADTPQLPQPTDEQRRIAAGQFERANQVISTGNYDYGIQLLLTCCKLDPGNLIYRQALRRTEKRKYNNNQHGSRLAFLTNGLRVAKMQTALARHEYLQVLTLAEQVLLRNPWDVGTQLAMAQAADELGLVDLAVWTLEQARQKDSKHAKVNRHLARLYERRGNFAQAIALWELIRKTLPNDEEASNKSKDLSAKDTIARGRYEQAITDRVADEEIEAEEAAPSSPRVRENSSSRARDGSSPRVREQPVEMPAAPADRVAHEAAVIQNRIQADPTNYRLHLQLASLYRRADRLGEARIALQEGLQMTGNHFELALELADLEIEPFRKNLTLTTDKLRREGSSHELEKIRIKLLKEINTRELDMYRQKAERYPTELGHRYELGVRLLRANQTDEAIRELQAARADPHHQWRSLYFLGFCFKNRNNWRLAQRNFEEALKNLPNGEEDTRKEILFQLAQGSADAGDLAHAVELGYELANLDFAYRDIGKLLDDWQTRLQQA